MVSMEKQAGRTEPWSVLCCVLSDGGVVSAPVNWTKGSKLGAGSFGQVFVCHDRDTGRDLAIKEVSVLCPLDTAKKVW